MRCPSENETRAGAAEPAGCESISAAPGVVVPAVAKTTSDLGRFAEYTKSESSVLVLGFASTHESCHLLLVSSANIPWTVPVDGSNVHCTALSLTANRTSGGGPQRPLAVSSSPNWKFALLFRPALCLRSQGIRARAGRHRRFARSDGRERSAPTAQAGDGERVGTPRHRCRRSHLGFPLWAKLRSPWSANGCSAA